METTKKNWKQDQYSTLAIFYLNYHPKHEHFNQLEQRLRIWEQQYNQKTTSGKVVYKEHGLSANRITHRGLGSPLIRCLKG
ncbi:hypothetical protein O9929_13275 [Vibrio lentus]|nr:hypothetical protein [Vibrio lentus]